MRVDTSKLPLGESDFTVIRNEGAVYVDKTKLVYELAKARAPIFLSRPRRFGKSLLVSTFDALFSRGLEDFHGLEIEKLWKEDRTYPVMRLDFSSLAKDDAKTFSSKFTDYLKGYLEPLGFKCQSEDPEKILNAFSLWLQRKSADSLVLLIDEYDAPLTRLLNKPGDFDFVLDLLGTFYSVLKENSRVFRFNFVTGVAKFQKDNIFSPMNIYTDISRNIKYGTILGYTEKELERYFSPYLDNAAKILKMTHEELLMQLEDQYDGFCFDRKGKNRLYAPWSVLSFLSEPEEGFLNYWVDTGGRSSLLLEYLKSHDFLEPEEFGKKQQTTLDELSFTYSYDQIQLIPLLTQTGYYAIESVENNKVILRYPNKEVFQSMGNLYLQVLYNFNNAKLAEVKDIGIAADKGDSERVVETINSAFRNIPHGTHNVITEEASVLSHMMMLLSGNCLGVIGEKANAYGRSDIVAHFVRYFYVFEFKFLTEDEKNQDEAAEKLLESAVGQIRNKKYGLELGSRKLIRLAMVFSEKERCFVKWQQVD